MTRIRLKRCGRKFYAFYQIVVADDRAPRDGRFIEKIGFYNPHSKELKIDQELLTKWLGNGAKPTETVKILIKKSKNQQSEKSAKVAS